MTDVRHTQELGVLDRIGRVTQELLESIRHQPIPERWIDLLNRLNAEEDARNLITALAPGSHKPSSQLKHVATTPPTHRVRASADRGA